MKALFASFLLLFMLGAPGFALAQPLPDGEQLYKQRCAACHESGVAPARATISRKSHAAIVQTLTSGVMKPQASGLKPEQIASLATYLAIKKPTLANSKSSNR